MAVVCAVDVGTRSARAGIIDGAGVLLGRGERPIAVNEPRPDSAEHSSADIWSAVCQAVKAARRAAGLGAEDIVGIAFDATCSLVVLDREGSPLPISGGADGPWDTVAWFDHRALGEARECTATGNSVLSAVGGVMSPEMQAPKAMWLKRHRPEIWSRIGYLFDLADYLTWRATGNAARSQCTLVSKWPYRPDGDRGWRFDFLAQVGLSDLLERGRLPARATPVGSNLGPLSDVASSELGLTRQCQVAAGLVDAFAGALGVFGAPAVDGAAGNAAALIAGTSSCVMTYSRSPQTLSGFWGGYFEATLPGLWMMEGGQSATGALLDHIVRTHSAGGEPSASRHAEIAARVTVLRARDGGAFADRLHVLPDFHGHRTPLSDPAALGVISGLSLDASFDGLCRLYWRACVGIALGIRHILEAMRDGPAPIDTLFVTGGHTRNPLLMELYADATGRRLVVPRIDEAMLLGAAMVAATGAGLYPDLDAACLAMQQDTTVRMPDASVKPVYDRDFRIFLEMHRQRQTLAAMI